ncbi:SAM-dependent methyltransferase [Lutimonas zeaxanthinifaciens]|uniref:SAM-dependent methyltransferase n=1 Tax=Lutimonas zeaxanthinifaciens TaxID=3060215 RepID=UPI00265CA028|nr:SAM-dependent methyltransferase [Lutimonas sp. YSD2104]WKK65032.1 SAM-dependent methyltransferase [Lutimonas sp. YSD2104]
MSSGFGKLYLIPTTLGDNEPLEVLPISVKKRVENIDFFIVENEKSARRFIKKITPRKSQPALRLFLLDKYTSEFESKSFLDPCFQGINVGLLSEAGVPAIADPGANIVMLAHQKKIEVVPMVGPSSIILAMMGSGLNGQNFAFNGYLPIEKVERKKRIKELERLSKQNDQTQIFIETPYRNQKLFNEFKAALTPSTLLCVAADLTLGTEYIKTLTIKEWKSENIDLHKRPCIFIYHKY